MKLVHANSLKVSTWCRACEFRLPRLQRNITRARERETERENSGTQIRTTSTAHQGFYYRHTLIPLYGGKKPKRKLDRTRQNWTWPPVRGSEKPGGGRQSGIRSMTAIYPAAFTGLCPHFAQGENISARAAQWCQVSSESAELRETNTNPCHSPPPASLQIYHCHPHVSVADCQSSLTH